jgi:excisionase family DNA binding protein
MSAPAPSVVVTTPNELRSIVAEEVERSLAALTRRLTEAASAPPPAVDLMKAKEVAAVVRLSVRELRRLVREGKFPAPLTIGTRSIRWRRADVERAVAEGGR